MNPTETSNTNLYSGRFAEEAEDFADFLSQYSGAKPAETEPSQESTDGSAGSSDRSLDEDFGRAALNAIDDLFGNE